MSLYFIIGHWCSFIDHFFPRFFFLTVCIDSNCAGIFIDTTHGIIIHVQLYVIRSLRFQFLIFAPFLVWSSSCKYYSTFESQAYSLLSLQSYIKQKPWFILALRYQSHMRLNVFFVTKTFSFSPISFQVLLQNFSYALVDNCIMYILFFVDILISKQVQFHVSRMYYT